MKVQLVSISSSNGVDRAVAALTKRLSKFIDVRTTHIHTRQQSKRIGGFLSLLLQRNRVKKEKGELLHVLTPMPFSVETCDLMTVYDIFGFKYLHTWADDVYKTTARWLEYKSIKTAPKIHAISEATKRDLVTYCGRSEDDIFVVPLGVDMEKFDIQEDAKKLSNTVLYVGDEHPRKNLKRLVRALSLIDPSPTLLWVGGELYMQERMDVRDLAAVLGVPLVETGRISDEELVDFYNRATILVHPHLRDGYALSPLEAEACGTLTAVSNVPTLSEMLGHLAFGFNPEDPEDMARGIELALKSVPKSLRERHILRNSVRRFDWDNIIVELLDVYRRLGDV